MSDQMWVHPLHAEIIILFWCFLLLKWVTYIFILTQCGKKTLRCPAYCQKGLDWPQKHIHKHAEADWNDLFIC